MAAAGPQNWMLLTFADLHWKCDVAEERARSMASNCSDRCRETKVGQIRRCISPGGMPCKACGARSPEETAPWVCGQLFQLAIC